MTRGWRRGLATVLLAASAACAQDPVPDAAHSRPNVVLVSVDTLRADFLEPYGAPIGLTPHVAAFAEEAAVFQDAITQATTTLPAHASLFFSVHPFAHQAYIGNRFAPAVTAPVQALKATGYETAAFVGGGQLAPGFGLDRGFGEYAVVDTRHIDDANRHADRLGELHAAAEGFLTEHSTGPFFLFLHTYEPHTPYAAPAEFMEQARAAGAGSIGADLEAPVREYRDDVGVPADDWAKDERRLHYAAEVAYVDAFLGDLLATIERLGLRDNTLVVLTADHGESLGERGVVGHNGFYDEQLRVPLLMRGPGVAPAAVAAPVQLVDVMPTLFAQAGIESPYPFAGRDLSPLLAGEPLGAPDPHRFAENKGHAAALRGQWKVVLSLRDADDFQLFDLATDPGELNDLSRERPTIAAELIGAYRDMVASSAQLTALFSGAGEHGHEELDDETRRQLRALGYLR